MIFRKDAAGDPLATEDTRSRDDQPTDERKAVKQGDYTAGREPFGLRHCKGRDETEHVNHKAGAKVHTDKLDADFSERARGHRVSPDRRPWTVKDDAYACMPYKSAACNALLAHAIAPSLAGGPGPRF